MSVGYYILIVVLLFVAEIFYFRIADRFNIIDKPNERSSHTAVTIRGGGIIFWIGAMTYFVVCGFPYAWFFLGLTLIAGVSFVDDIHPLPDKVRLVIQFIAMGLMLYELLMNNDVIIHTIPVWQLILLGIVALIVTVGIINAYNFMDGINGITGGYSLVVLGIMAYVNEKVIPFIDEQFIGTIICAVMVFCFFNFRRKAKCFAGDVGSVGIAFIIVFLLGKLMLASHNIGWIILLACYGVDTVLTICHRIMLHENLGQAHRKHMYQIMANELHMSHLLVTSIYIVIQLAIAIMFIQLPSLWTLIVTCFILSVIYIWFMRRYFHLHMKKN